MAVLELRDFGIAFGDRVVIADMNLSIDGPGVTSLLGAAGAGKSSLVRTITGANEGQITLQTWGEANYQGEPLAGGSRPMLVAQNAKLLMSTVLDNLMVNHPDRPRLFRGEQREVATNLLESSGLGDLVERLDDPVINLPMGEQRLLAIARTAVADPPLLCVDEPTADLSEAESERVLELLAREAKSRALLFITHHQSHARTLGGRSVLLAGGRIIADASTPDFFENPDSVAAEKYVRTGSIRLPLPGTPPENLADDEPPPPSLSARGIAALNIGNQLGPKGFRWLEPGTLGGTPRPGLMDDLDRELDLLQQIGVRVLVCLTGEDPPVDAAELAARGIESEHLPMPDMGVPTVEEARELCRSIDDWRAQGKPVALHCRGGLGRTGTLLAAHLIWRGRPALEALELVRRVEPKYVQSNAQVDFLEAFDAYVRAMTADAC